MTFTLDRDQLEVLADVLHNAARELRFELVHADVRDFRHRVLERERILESMIAQLPDELREPRDVVPSPAQPSGRATGHKI
ncbi:MAG: hypothetical protein ACTHU0_27585 [Kofleriaceae bacterium]